jgi:polysaccharide biosynthesis protein PslJ
MRALGGADQRSPVVPTTVALAGLAILSVAVVSGIAVAPVALLIAIGVMLVTGYPYTRVLQWRMLLVGIIVIILFVPIRRYTLPGHLPFNFELYRIVVALVLAGWLVALLVDPKVRLAHSILDRLFALLVSAVLLSDVLNPGRVNSVGSNVPKALSFFLSYVLVYYLILSVVRDWRTIDFLLKVLVGGGSVVGAFALIERRTDYNVFNHLHTVAPFLRFQGAIGAAGLERGGTRLRVYGPAEHPIALGALFVMLLPLAVYLARRTAQRRWWAAALVLALGAFATVSRTAVIMLAVVALVFLRLRPRETKRLWPLIIPALAAVHVAAPGTLGSLRAAFFPKGGLIAQQSNVVAGNQLRSNGRLSDIGPSLHELAPDPIFGEGYGTRIVGFDEKYNNAAILDDQWLGTLLETGIVGFFAWIWIFCRCVRRLSRSAREDDSDGGWLYTGLAASIAAFGVGMATFDAFSFTQEAFVFFILLALAGVLLSRGGLREAAARTSA